MTKYYDPEYDRVVTEEVPKKQYGSINRVGFVRAMKSS